MVWTKPLGIVLLVLSVPLLLAALILFFSEEPFTEDMSLAGDRSAVVYAAVGGASLLLGVVLMMVKPAAKKPKAAEPTTQQQRTIDIKRTEMNVGRAAPTAAASPHASLQAELDEVNRRIARLKVQYGMGDVSKESYRRLMDDLERTRADVEMRLMETPS